jgi:hypothetical protein
MSEFLNNVKTLYTSVIVLSFGFSENHINFVENDLI